MNIHDKYIHVKSFVRPIFVQSAKLINPILSTSLKNNYVALSRNIIFMFSKELVYYIFCFKFSVIITDWKTRIYLTRHLSSWKLFNISQYGANTCPTRRPNNCSMIQNH
jgi:hypothetical protein